MDNLPLPSQADRFAQFVDLTCDVIAARSRGGMLPGALIVLLWQRVRGIAVRVAA